MTDRQFDDAPKPKRRHIFLWIVVAIVILGAGYWILQPYQIKTNGGRHGAGGAAVPVVTAVAHKGDIDIIQQALGTVTAPASITVRTQINGILMQVGFQEGQIVQAGDFLAQIDPRPYQMQLEQAQGALQRDQALLVEAELNLERYKKLVAQDSIAKQQLDTQQSLVDQYKGNVLTDQGQIDTANLDLTYCHITAPVTGRVGLRQVDQGNYVQTSDANGLVMLTQLQPIDVLFTVPEDNIPAIMKRFSGGAELQATAYDRTDSNKLATGKLISTDNQIDVTTGTVKLRAEFDNQDNALFPNQFVNIGLLVDTLKDAIVVPSAAIQRGAPGTFVYLVKDDNTVTVKVIKLGPQQGDNVAVTSGLAEGDKVVIDGADKLREGASITLPSENGKAATAAPADGAKDASKNDAGNATNDSTKSDTQQHHHHKDKTE